MPAFLTRTAFIGALTFALAAPSHAVTLLSEGFDDVPSLPASGWVRTNLSSPEGLSWGQGFVGPFAAQAGNPDAYAAVNFESAAFGSGGVIDNWLITPTLAFGASNAVTFWTRTIFNPSVFPDRLELRLSLADGSADTDTFTTLLISVNPELTTTGYPNQWTQYSASFTATPGAVGRLAFRYTPPSSAAADFIGLDSVSVAAVPEPETCALMLGGLTVVALMAKKRRRTLQFT